MLKTIFKKEKGDVNEFINNKTKDLKDEANVGLGVALSLYLNMYVDLTLLNGSDITGEGDAN